MLQKLGPSIWIAAVTALVIEIPAMSPAMSDDASQNQFERSSYDSSMGRSLGGEFQTGVSADDSSALATVLLTVLDIDLKAMQAISTPPSTPDGVAYNEIYSFGMRIFDQNGYFHNNLTGFTAGLAPTEVRIPIFIYPIGPVALEVDGGARFQADVNGQMLIGIGIPISYSTLGVQLNASAVGAGFVEGYANLLAVRAGVGGQVDLVDAGAPLNASLFFNGLKPLVTINAMVDFLKGQFYGFIDYMNPLSFGWTRWQTLNLYSWKGYCYQTGGDLCP
jgi:hypothetical protein